MRFFVFPDAARAPKHRTANARRPRPIRGDGACLKVFGGPAGGRVHRRGCLARTYAPVGMSRADICAHGDVPWEICTGGDILREICTSGDARHSLGGYAGHLVTTHTNPVARTMPSERRCLSDSQSDGFKKVSAGRRRVWRRDRARVAASSYAVENSRELLPSSLFKYEELSELGRENVVGGVCITQ